MALGVSPRIKFPSLPALSSPEKTLSVHPSFLPTHPSAFTRCWNFHFQVTFSCGKIITLFTKGKWLIFLIVEKLIRGKDVELAVLQPLWADYFAVREWPVALSWAHARASWAPITREHEPTKLIYTQPLHLRIVSESLNVQHEDLLTLCLCHFCLMEN